MQRLGRQRLNCDDRAIRVAAMLWRGSDSLLTPSHTHPLPRETEQERIVRLSCWLQKMSRHSHLSAIHIHGRFGSRHPLAPMDEADY